MTAVQVLVAMVATLAFSIRFAAPARQYVFCALAGGITWLFYSLCLFAGSGVLLATFIAILMLVLACRLFSALRKTPTVVFLFAGIFPLVPGIGIFNTAYYIFLGNAALAGQHSLHTLTASGAIVLGILFGYAVPQGVFNRLGGAPPPTGTNNA